MRTVGLTVLLAFTLALTPSGRAAAQGTVLIVNGQPVQATPVTAAPVAADVPPAQPARPRGAHVGQSLAIAGGAVLAAGWVFGFAIGLFGGYHDRTCWIGPCSTLTSWDPAWDDFRGTSLIPLVGPWIQLAVKPPSGPDGWPTFLVIDGLVQGIGAILLFVGVGIMGSEQDEPPPVAVLPIVSPTQAGLQVLGSF